MYAVALGVQLAGLALVGVSILARGRIRPLRILHYYLLVTLATVDRARRLPAPRRAGDLGQGGRDEAVTFYERHGKRALDVAGGAVLGVAGAPLMAAAAALLWRTQGRPILFHQTRVGRGGREFTIVKFRTMVPGAASRGAGMWFEPDDPRVTPVGRWLRATSIDELPQVWNVLGATCRSSGPVPSRARSSTAT